MIDESNTKCGDLLIESGGDVFMVSSIDNEYIYLLNTKTKTIHTFLVEISYVQSLLFYPEGSYISNIIAKPKSRFEMIVEAQ